MNAHVNAVFAPILAGIVASCATTSEQQTHQNAELALALLEVAVSEVSLSVEGRPEVIAALNQAHLALITAVEQYRVTGAFPKRAVVDAVIDGAEAAVLQWLDGRTDLDDQQKERRRIRIRSIKRLVDALPWTL